MTLIQRLVIVQGVEKYINDIDKLIELSDEYKKLFGSDLKTDWENAQLLSRKVFENIEHTL